MIVDKLFVRVLAMCRLSNSSPYMETKFAGLYIVDPSNFHLSLRILIQAINPETPPSNSVRISDLRNVK